LKRQLGLCAVVGLAILTGCGGGGAMGGSTSATGRAVLLLTDSFREDYAHVWATIYRVELIPQSGTPIVLFDDAAGHQIDLKTLRDAAGARFSFLGSAAIPAGTYTGVTVTIAPTMQLFRNGTAVGAPLTVDTALPKDTGGNPILTNTFATPKTFGTETNTVIVDFDLAQFVIRNSNVLPAITDGSSVGVGDPKRHNRDEYRGTVSALSGTSPTLTFTLTRRNGQTISVSTTESTAMYGKGTLADGSTVEVTGTLDTTAQTLVATAVEVHPVRQTGNGHGEGRTPNVSGAASSLDAAAGTFTVTVNRTCGFAPEQTSVSVVTNAETTFYTDAGQNASQADFFTALAATPNVIAKGTYDEATNTLTATSVRVVDGTQDGGWMRDKHSFRRGGNAQNWGNGVVRR
jgi:hypothetical protein